METLPMIYENPFGVTIKGNKAKRKYTSKPKVIGVIWKGEQVSKNFKLISKAFLINMQFSHVAKLLANKSVYRIKKIEI